MENQASNTIPPITNAPPQVAVTPTTNWMKIVPLVVLVLVLMGGSVFVGIQIGKGQVLKQNTNLTPTDQNPTITPNQDMPTLVVTASPTPDATVSWKRVYNEQVGISFKYPDNLLPYASTPQIPDSTYFGFDAYSSQEKRDHRSLTESDLELELIVYKPAKTSIEPYLSAIRASDDTTVTQPFPGITGSFIKVKTLTSGSIQTAIIYAEPAREYSEYDAIVVDGNNVAIIKLMTGSHSKKQQLLPIIEQIASSFKFSK
nr:MAG: hypothetical protein A2V48_01490 [Candidatus Amesbacteria bacterium RBG_19FT_COMBO_48_16]